jgi:phosphoglycerol transferase
MSRQHIMLGGLYPVPLAVWLTVRVFHGAEFLARHPTTGRLAPPFLSARGFGAVAVCALIACTGAYYAFFTCGLLVVAGVAAAVRGRSLLAPLPAVVFVALIAGGLAANLAPALAYRNTHGPNPELKRPVAEGNEWALRPAELLLPSPYHRSKKFGAISTRYTTAFQGTVNPVTAVFSPLGVAVAVGLLIGLASLVRRGDGVERTLGVLLVVALLIAVSGGFGALFNLFVSPWVRGYYRLGVFIGFLAAVSLALALTRLAPPTAGRWRRAAVGVASLALVGFGLYDQTPRPIWWEYDRRAAEFEADRRFVRAVEAALPDGAAVFHLPFVLYPEPGYVSEIDNYTPSLGYLHSDGLRWGYGAMRGRAAGEWQKAVSGLPAGELMTALTDRGYEAVWVDRWGYPGRVSAVEADLAMLAPDPPLVSENGRYAVYRLPAGRPPAAPAEAEVIVEWGNGFDVEESVATPAPRVFRWGRSEATLTLVNRAPGPRRCRLFFSASSHAAGPCRLTVTGPAGEHPLTIGAAANTWVREFELPPGRHPVRFACDGAPGVYPERTVVFAVANARVGVVGRIPAGGDR